jgi:hypothetical protein
MYATQDREGEEAKPKTGSAAVGFHAGPWYSGELGAAGASQAGNVKALPNESSALPFEHEGTFASTAQQTHSLCSCPATRQQH